MNNKGFGLVEYIIILLALVLLVLAFHDQLVTFISWLVQPIICR